MSKPESTSELQARIACLQDIQKRSQPSSREWLEASNELAPLFEEMATQGAEPDDLDVIVSELQERLYSIEALVEAVLDLVPDSKPVHGGLLPANAARDRLSTGARRAHRAG
jgi:hypothetical protein